MAVPTYSKKFTTRTLKHTLDSPRNFEYGWDFPSLRCSFKGMVWNFLRYIFLGDGFKYGFIFTPIHGEMIQFEEHFFFRCVAQTPTSFVVHKPPVVLLKTATCRKAWKPFPGGPRREVLKTPPSTDRPFDRLQAFLFASELGLPKWE